MRLVSLIKRYLRRRRLGRTGHPAERLHVVGPTVKLIRGSIGPEADWHGRYEAGR